MTTHDLELNRRTLHGCFGSDLASVLEIDDGDTVIFHTLDAGWGEELRKRGAQALEVEKDDERDQGHALCGPVRVHGAKPGDVLEVRIGEIRPGPMGWTWAGPRPWMTYDLRVRKDVVIAWKLDVEAGTATDMEGLGLQLQIAPFMGVMGNAPNEVGPLSTAPPRRVGGNLDCRLLVSGSTLWLPVEVDGALFSVGDGHALQGDGEASNTAIECPMDKVELTFRVRPDMEIYAPQAKTADGFLALGLGYDLDSAAASALDQMVSHIQLTYSLPRAEAMALASLAVHLHVTQIANGVRGVHAILPESAITAQSPQAHARQARRPSSP
jgi:acetamidase/formamidase